MEEPLLITWLNDFIFCPASIYFRMLYGETERIAFQQPSQINGSAAHERIDSGRYSIQRFGYAKNEESDIIIVT